MHEILGVLIETKSVKEEFVKSGTLEYLIEHCLLKGDPTTGGSEVSKNDK